MEMQSAIGELENAINSYKRGRSFLDYTLPAELRLMASLDGRMIYQRLSRYDLAFESIAKQQVIQRWSQPDLKADSYDDKRKPLQRTSV